MRQSIINVINELSQQGCEVEIVDGKIRVWTEHRDEDEEDYAEDMARNVATVEALFKQLGI